MPNKIEGPSPDLNSVVEFPPLMACYRNNKSVKFNSKSKQYIPRKGWKRYNSSHYIEHQVLFKNETLKTMITVFRTPKNH